MGAPETFKQARRELAGMVKDAEGQLEHSLARMAMGRTTFVRFRMGAGNPTLMSVCALADALGFRLTFEKVRR